MVDQTSVRKILTTNKAIPIAKQCGSAKKQILTSIWKVKYLSKRVAHKRQSKRDKTDTKHIHGSSFLPMLWALFHTHKVRKRHKKLEFPGTKHLALKLVPDYGFVWQIATIQPIWHPYTYTLTSNNEHLSHRCNKSFIIQYVYTVQCRSVNVAKQRKLKATCEHTHVTHHIFLACCTYSSSIFVQHLTVLTSILLTSNHTYSWFQKMRVFKHIWKSYT